MSTTPAIHVSGRAAETAAPRLADGDLVLIVGRVASSTGGSVNVVADRIDSPALFRAADVLTDQEEAA